MTGWREQWRKRLFRFGLPAVVGENPLEIAMIGWGGFSAVNAALGEPPSTALQALPSSLEIGWAVMMCLAGIVVLFALKTKKDHFVSSGMYLFSATMFAYSLAVLSASDWSKGGAVASLLAIMGIVCFVRGWWLKEVEAQQIRHVVRNRSRG